MKFKVNRRIGTILSKLIMLILAFGLVSCLPEENQYRELEDGSAISDTDDTDSATTDSSSNDNSLAIDENFLQEGTVKTTSALNISSSFQDSFLIRGNELTSYLKHISANTKFCAAFYFDNAIDNKLLILSAKIRSFENYSIDGQEYYLQLEASNESANIAECNKTDLKNSLITEHGILSTDITFKLSDLCPSCINNVLSSPIKVYTPTGHFKSEVNTRHLSLNITSGGTGNTSQACSTNAACGVQGYDCCRNGQCVNHGEIKSSVNQSSADYTTAFATVTQFPWLIQNYEHIWHVCPQMVPTESNTGTIGSGSGGTPTENSIILVEELRMLYNCLNPLQDETSICTKTYEDAEELINTTSGTSFSVGLGDLNFSSINGSISSQNIYSIHYGTGVLYLEDTTSLDASNGSFGSSNDNLTSAQAVTIKADLPNSAPHDNLHIGYKVDGTCEKISNSIARCKKYYKQGQSSTPARSSDHSASSNSFKIPSYADLTYTVMVKVGESSVPTGNDTWSLSGYNVVFNSVTNPIYNNQELAITFFVTTNVSNLMEGKDTALAAVQNHCSCSGEECNLSEVKDNEGNVEFYECVYPQPDTQEPPLQQTVFVSNKTAPHKFFDSNGVYYDQDDVEYGAVQEGNTFEYTANDPLRPNNVSSDVGFNEIYGSMNKGSTSPIPAKVIDVKKGRNYDLITDQGIFSTCLTCGGSYYSNLQKMFPQTFTQFGAGYMPDSVESRRVGNKGDYRADDLLFGRACFLPATMIPWTHVTNSDIQTQRLNRLAAQHFLFANGQNRDWYGFDYGSVIGSWDGVTWFSIGNSRRIKSKSNKLFIAVNAYYGDVTSNNAYRVTVSEISAILYSGSDIMYDSDSDGAECQQYHFCSNDNDCITQLGYDYACENVSGMRTSWPVMDNAGNEISGSNDVSFAALIGGVNGQINRCVYRGRGAACNVDAHTVARADSFNNTTQSGLLTCSSNHYCADLSESRFNKRISRYARAAANQNASTHVSDDTDTIGLGARVLGRPYNYYGTDSVDGDILTQLNTNKVDAICIPGKAPDTAFDTASLNSTAPATYVDSADKTFGIGPTIKLPTLSDPNYYSACPATDADGKYIVNSSSSIALNGTKHDQFAIAQNIPSNSMSLEIFDDLELFNDVSGGSVITQKGYQHNTCLRAAGASCFTDLDCAPSEWMANKANAISDFGSFSEAEEEFWKTGLTCGNGQDRYLANAIYPNPDYELKKHKCCRETTKTFRYFSQPHTGGDFEAFDTVTGAPQAPGVEIDINSTGRYSAVNTVYDAVKDKTAPVKSFDRDYNPTVVASPVSGPPFNLNAIFKRRQFNTIDLHNKRMCCTGHWVRELASGEDGNGGGHKFENTKLQNIDKAIFQSISWTADNTAQPPLGDNEIYSCTGTNYQTLACEIKYIPEGGTEETMMFEWLGTLELIGIPQILVKTATDIFSPLDGSQDSHPVPNDGTHPFAGTIKSTATAEKIDVNDGTTNYYSAANYDNFEIEGSGNLKKIFSEDKFACCLPTGVEVAATTPSDACCTGQAHTANNARRCCLNDYTDLSVYTNRYVSSEGSGLDDSEYDDNGYIKSKEKVMELASSMCCSGIASYGVAVSILPIPLNDGLQIMDGVESRRFVYNEMTDNDTGIASKYDVGVRWNNHVYCVPEGFEDGGGDGGDGGSSTVDQ